MKKLFLKALRSEVGILEMIPCIFYPESSPEQISQSSELIAVRVYNSNTEYGFSAYRRITEFAMFSKINTEIFTKHRMEGCFTTNFNLL